MIKQTILWTALPNGVAAVDDASGQRVLKLSVFVHPRLSTDVTPSILELFDDFEDWPSTEISFSVKFNNDPPIPASRVGPAPRSDLWTSLFKPSTFVRPFEFSGYHDRKIRSYPVRHVMSFIKEQYQKFALEDPTEYPAINKLLLDDNNNLVSFGKIGFFNAVEFGGPDEKVLTYQLEGRLSKDFAILFDPNPDPPLDFLQLKRFHRQRNMERRRPPEIPEIDFHQVISALGEYPELMRLLGLVHDLELPFPELGGLNPTVQVIADWSPAIPTENKSLKTHCVIDGTTFAALPKPGSDLVNGMLELGDKTKFELVQLDHDGAAIKAMGFANELLRSYFRRSQDTPEEYSIPSLRSGGLAVARVGRAMAQHQKLLNINSLNSDIKSNSDAPMYADDLLRGYRVDIWDAQSSTWHSLCQRRGRYEFLDSNLVVEVDDEGIVTTAATQASDESSPDLYLQETLFRWAGWSLCAPRPGNTIGPQDAPERIENEPATEFQLKTTFLPYPGSLPSLRYGLRYRIRARAVDLAGNSLPFDTPGLTSASERITYGRFEPVSSPALVKRKPITEGESVERMVMRSYNYADPTSDSSERHIAPPKTSQLMAEEHGLFNVPNASNTELLLDKDAYDMIKDKDPGSFATAPGGTPDPNDHDEPYFDLDQLVLPYLPDLFSRGVSLRGLPGTFGSTERFDFGTSPWPDALPFRIELKEGNGPPLWNNIDRVLEVYLPKADVARIRYSSFLNEADLAHTGIWKWILEKATPEQIEGLVKSAVNGTHWMLTPYRVLTMIHAVKQPLLPPQFKTLKALKTLGATFATLTDKVDVNGKSTSKLTVKADWKEPIDNLRKAMWEEITGEATAFELPTEYDDTAVSIRNPHEFGDTKYRRVNYNAVFTTRFSEYFVERKKLTFTNEAPQLLDAAGVVEGSETVVMKETIISPPPDDDPKNARIETTTYTRGTDYDMDYAAGTISWIAVGSIPVNKEVEVAYLVPPITRETPGPTTLDIPNSARPDAPKILYVLPTFKWKKQGGKKSIRYGQGLRIYLERPWWSSGEGELLGVVIWEKPPWTLGGIPDRLRPYVTQWGMDPIWKSNPTKNIPNLNDFKRVARTETGLTLEEVPGTNFSVAGYKVEYDEERKLWYSDIKVDVGNSYFPFIRLALGRYQPISVSDAHLSRVVLADFAQLAPDRTATLTYDKNDPNKVNITVAGLSYKKVSGISGPSIVEVSLELKDSRLKGELAWIPVSNSTIRLTESKIKPRGQKVTIWTGSMIVPMGPSNQFRLVIKEYELFPSGKSTPPTTRRLVYADHIEL